MSTSSSNRRAGVLAKLARITNIRRRTFLARNEGAILVEAGIVLPILLMMFVGMAEFSLAFTARRKVVAVANTTADLVAQRMSVGTSDLNDIVSISNSLMKPYTIKSLSMTITSVGLDAGGKSATLWSCSFGIITGPPCTEAQQGCTASGAAFELPEGLPPQPGNSIIVVEATYTYRPPIGQFLLGGVTFHPKAYFKPRLVPCVVKL